MIMRVVRVTVHEGQEDEFEKVLKTIVLPTIRSHAGFVSVVPGKPRADAPNVFCVTIVWEDVQALKGFAGENWMEVRTEPEEEHLIASTTVEHYDLISG